VRQKILLVGTAFAPYRAIDKFTGVLHAPTVEPPGFLRSASRDVSITQPCIAPCCLPLPRCALEAAAADDSFLAHLHGVSERLDAYLSFKGTWYNREHGAENNLLGRLFFAGVRYHRMPAIFAGGLGMLAGDHLKAASDLALPLVAVGLLYQEG
jgi:hypothetical protein